MRLFGASLQLGALLIDAGMGRIGEGVNASA